MKKILSLTLVLSILLSTFLNMSLSVYADANLPESEIEKLVIDFFYKNNSGLDGDFVIFDSETTKTNNGYLFVVRYQGGNTANVLHAIAEVNIKTGEMFIDDNYICNIWANSQSQNDEYASILTGDFSEFAGTYSTPNGTTMELLNNGLRDIDVSDGETEFRVEDITKETDGTYTWSINCYVEGECFGGVMCIIYPKGIDVVSYNGDFLYTDSSKTRLWIGQDVVCDTEYIWTKQEIDKKPLSGLPNKIEITCGNGSEFIELNQDKVKLEIEDTSIARIGDGLWADEPGVTYFSVVPKFNGTTKLTATSQSGEVLTCEVIVHSGITVLLNDEKIEFDQQPIIKNDRTLVPLRAIFEAMGATVDWNDATKTVTSTLDSITVSLTIGSNILYKNGTAVALDVPAQLINGYTMVPARAVAEAFGADVRWDGDTRTVHIKTSKNTYYVSSVPQITYDGLDANFADFNGMYIDSYTHTRKADGTENVEFDVYNTTYIYGFVEIYNKDNKLIDVAVIDKMSNSTSIKGVLIDDTGKLIKDLWTGNALTYRQESGYSKKTTINVDIPQGGYIKITNDMSSSFIASAVNLSDMVFGAKKTFDSLKGFNSNASKEYAQKLSLKLIKDVAFSEMLENPDKYAEELYKGVGDKLYMNSESIGGFLNTVSKNLDELADGEFTSLMLSTAMDCGIGIAEGTFEALAGPAGVALKAIFTITSVGDILIEMNDGLDCMYNGYIKIIN